MLRTVLYYSNTASRVMRYLLPTPSLPLPLSLSEMRNNNNGGGEALHDVVERGGVWKRSRIGIGGGMMMVVAPLCERTNERTSHDSKTGRGGLETLGREREKHLEVCFIY